MVDFSDNLKIPIFAQHVDGVNYGSHTGSILPEAVRYSGAVGTLVNHAECQMSWEEIEKTINSSDLGLNPSNDGEVIRIPIPSLSEERRIELGKVASKISEESKVAIRNHRRSAMSEIDTVKSDYSEDEVKRYEKDIQDITDKFITKIDDILKKKQDELLEV